MAVIKKKCWPDLFELVKSGKKNFDLRLADFEVKEGDALILEEWNPQTQSYTGRTLEKAVKYIFKFHLDDFQQKRDIEEKGLYIIQL